jgi:tRNA threonylcarbamoyladenosine biosynthesis protein TsaB
MLILSLDTTAHFGSVALLKDASVVEEVVLHSPEGFGPILFGRIESLLRRNGVRVGEVGLFAAAAGPGSFTGVRIGLTAVKGLAEACGRPVVGVSNLMALGECGTGPLRAALLDARRGEIYGAVYDADLNVVRPEVVMPFRDWVDSLPNGEIQFVSTDLGPFRASLPEAVCTEQRALAAAVGRVALRLPGLDAAAVDANYVRRSDAELLWKD